MSDDELRWKTYLPDEAALGRLPALARNAEFSVGQNICAIPNDGNAKASDMYCDGIRGDGRDGMRPNGLANDASITPTVVFSLVRQQSVATDDDL